ncbi:AMP-dependent synthetase/ligase [Penicillium expansum]|nr:AMP-dependent synthetase/ligase [Penicillium expansum]
MQHKDSDLCELFAHSVRRSPDELAVDHESGSLTYTDLDAASTYLAQKLQQRGVEEGDIVCLLTEHGTLNIIALLAVLKAKACYVPLDRSSWSRERIENVLSSVDSQFLINTTGTSFEHIKYTIIHLQTVDIPRSTGSSEYAAEVSTINAPEALACIIFTSGSTGKPKGVMLSHRAIANYGHTSPFNMDVQAGDRVLHILSVAFDASTGMLFSILGNSGTVVPASMDTLYDKAQTCSILASTPSILATLPLPSSLPDSYLSVHTILLGGETPNGQILSHWLDFGVRILNAYGPTETTCASLMQEVEVSRETGTIRSSIIGSPMSQGPVYLLRNDLTLVDDYDTDGEIVISGIGLADEYYRDPALTAERFITWRGIRVYRTGDQGRWIRRNDGTRVMDFRGRSDRTVKNRGFLVNLAADVEEPLRMMGCGVSDVYASMIESRLVVLSTLLLPLPDHYCAAEQFPISPNGKIDSRAILKLLDHSQDQLLAASSAILYEGSTLDDSSMTSELSGDMATVVSECMCTALGLDIPPSQIDFNFFALGGNSLTALRFTSLCRERGISITTPDIYRHPTLRGVLRCAHALEPIPSAIESDCGNPTPQLSALREEVAAQLNLGKLLPLDIQIGRLTPLQLELAAPTLERNGTNTNQLQLTYPLRDAEHICDAWKRVIECEPVFRTQISLDIACGVQIQHALHPHHLKGSKVGSYICHPVEATFRRREDYDAALTDPALLSVGLGMRLDVMKLMPDDTGDKPGSKDAGEVTINWTAHHALLDGYSVGLILTKVQRAVQGQHLSMSPSFMDASGGLLAIQSQRDGEARRFWAGYLESVRSLPILNDQRRSQETNNIPYRAQEIRFSCADRLPQIQKLAEECKVTLATVYYLHGQWHWHNIQGGTWWSWEQSSLLRRDASIPQQLEAVMEGLATISAYAWSSSDQIGYRLDNLMATQYDFPPIESAFLLAEKDAGFRLVYDPAVHSDQHMQTLSQAMKSALNTLPDATTIGSWLDYAGSAFENLHHNSTLKMECGATQSHFNLEAHIAKAFEVSADRHAHLVALEGPECTLSYAELDRLSNVVCNRLRQDVPNAQTVAIHADGSINWDRLTVPLDPAYSMDRRLAVYTRSGADALLIPNACPTAMLKLPDIHVLVVADLLSCSAFDAISHRPPLSAKANDDALIVFTSGTTGRPKGVPISHRGFLALQSNPEATMFSCPGRRIAQFMSPAFDYCANEVFSALLHGATLVLRDPSDPLAHLAKVDVSTITPSVLSALDPTEYPNLRMVYATGEPVTPGLLDRWAANRVFYNAYGPAECSICTSFTRLVPGQQVTIGKAIQTARMYILTPELHPVRDGTTGEIFLAGEQVMRGYIGDDQQTAHRVLPDPWHDGERMYRTGDYGYWTNDQQICYVGRLDRQVKVRGFRVELASVEMRMYEEEPQLIQAATMVVNDNLVAFVMPSSIDVAHLEQRLRETLQPSWVPQMITPLDEFPWTTNRKVDYQRLKEIGTLAVTKLSTPLTRPFLDHIAEGITGIWKILLPLVDDVELGPDDDFRRLGGHSILQMLLAARLASVYGISMTTRDVIEHPKLGEQALLALPDHHLSELERQTWFQYLVASDLLIQSLNAVLASRKLLRSNFIETSEGPIRVFRNNPPRVQECKLIYVAREIARGFDLARDELIRVFMDQQSLLLVTSHAIADLNSVQNLFRETAEVYRGSTAQVDRLNYLQASAWSRKATPEERHFWIRYLDGAPQRLPINRDLTQTSFEGTSRICHFDGTMIHGLTSLTRKYGVTKHQIVCAATAQMLQWLCATDDVVLGCPWENRTSDLERRSNQCAKRVKKAVAYAIPFEQILDILHLPRTIRQHPIFEVMVTFHLKGAMEDCLDVDGLVVQREMCYAPGSKFLLMFEWTELEADHWVLRTEYDHHQIAPATINLIDQALRCVLEGFSLELSRSAIEKRLAHTFPETKEDSNSEGEGDDDTNALCDRLVGILRREMAACLGIDLADFPCSVSFFEAGGNSIDVWRLQRQLKRVGVDMPISTVFELPTAQALAWHLCKRVGWLG